MELVIKIPEEVYKDIMIHNESSKSAYYYEGLIKNSTPLEQEPKTGRWILDETDNSITCDKCGCLIWANDISNGEAYYCPNCGCRMAESEDVEVVHG